MPTDYYATLEVKRNAAKEEILSAYRRLARKYHPDLNPDDPTAKQKFQQVQTAFDVLSDPQKRDLYDRYGDAHESMGTHAGPGRQPWPGGRRDAQGGNFNFEDLFGGGERGGGFADFFKQFSQQGRGADRAKEMERGKDLLTEISVPFVTAVLGGERQIALIGPEGRREAVQVKIPAGVEDGQKIRLRGQGQLAPRGGPRGDAILTVRVAPHAHFHRSGKRLDVQVPISLAEALEGAKIDLPTPHGVITLTIPPGSSSGKRLRVKGHGVRPAKGPPGDLFAELCLVLPQDLPEEQRQQIVAIVGHSPKNPRADLTW